MIVTEQEAKERWCPFVRAATGQSDGNAANSGTEPSYRNPTYARCIGTACMAWDWRDPEVEYITCEANEKPASPEWEFSTRNVRTSSWKRPMGDRRRGACGLAGRPE